MARVTAALAVAVAAGIAVATAGPASATIDVHDRYANSFSDTFSDCGIAVIRLDHEDHGIFTARTVRGSDGTAWFAHDNYSVVDTLTNPENGRSFSISYDGNLRELHATRIDGNVWRFDWKDSGATWVLRDGSGQVVSRDRGTLSGFTIIDTEGDDQPGGLVLDQEVTSLKGKYSAFHWCEDLVVPLLG